MGEAWALSLSPDGRTLNTTTHDGRVIIWDTSSLKRIGEMETKGSFGTSIACVLSPLDHLSNCSLLIDDTLLLGIKMAEYTFSVQRQTEYCTICQVRSIHLRSKFQKGIQAQCAPYHFRQDQIISLQLATQGSFLSTMYSTESKLRISQAILAEYCPWIGIGPDSCF